MGSLLGRERFAGDCAILLHFQYINKFLSAEANKHMLEVVCYGTESI